MDNSEIHQTLGRVDGKLDIVIASQSHLATKLDDLAKTQAAHGERITALEARNGALKGTVAILIAAIAAFAAAWKDFFH